MDTTDGEEELEEVSPPARSPFALHPFSSSSSSSTSPSRQAPPSSSGSFSSSSSERPRVLVYERTADRERLLSSSRSSARPPLLARFLSLSFSLSLSRCRTPTPDKIAQDEADLQAEEVVAAVVPDGELREEEAPASWARRRLFGERGGGGGVFPSKEERPTKKPSANTPIAHSRRLNLPLYFRASSFRFGGIEMSVRTRCRQNKGRARPAIGSSRPAIARKQKLASILSSALYDGAVL